MRRLRRMCAGIMAAVMVMSMTPSVPSYASEADSIAGNTEAISGTMFDAGIDDAEDAGGGTNAETQDEDVDAAIGGAEEGSAEEAQAEDSNPESVVSPEESDVKETQPENVNAESMASPGGNTDAEAQLGNGADSTVETYAEEGDAESENPLNSYVELPVDENGTTKKSLDLTKMSTITATTWDKNNGTQVVAGNEYLSTLLDGNRTNKKDFYAENGGKGGYIQCDFGEGYGIKLTEVLFASYSDSTNKKPNDWKCLVGTYIAGSNDGETWKPLTDKAVETQEWQTMNVSDTIDYRYIRITNDDTAWWGVIGEVRFFGEKVATTYVKPEEPENPEQEAPKPATQEKEFVLASDQETVTAVTASKENSVSLTNSQIFGTGILTMKTVTNISNWQWMVMPGSDGKITANGLDSFKKPGYVISLGTYDLTGVNKITVTSGLKNGNTIKGNVEADCAVSGLESATEKSVENAVSSFKIYEGTEVWSYAPEGTSLVKDFRMEGASSNWEQKDYTYEVTTQMSGEHQLYYRVHSVLNTWAGNLSAITLTKEETIPGGSNMRISSVKKGGTEISDYASLGISAANDILSWNTANVTSEDSGKYTIALSADCPDGTTVTEDVTVTLTVESGDTPVTLGIPTLTPITTDKGQTIKLTNLDIFGKRIQATDTKTTINNWQWMVMPGSDGKITANGLDSFKKPGYVISLGTYDLTGVNKITVTSGLKNGNTIKGNVEADCAVSGLESATEKSVENAVSSFKTYEGTEVWSYAPEGTSLVKDFRMEGASSSWEQKDYTYEVTTQLSGEHQLYYRVYSVLNTWAGNLSAITLTKEETIPGGSNMSISSVKKDGAEITDYALLGISLVGDVFSWKTLQMNNAAAGKYTITFSATGADGAAVENTVDITVNASTINYNHPGILFTEGQIANIKANYLAGTEPWKSAGDELLAGAVKDYTAKGLEAVKNSDNTIWTDTSSVTNGHGFNNGFRDDCQMAYRNALAYILTGDSGYAESAIKILNDYTGVKPSIQGKDKEFVASQMAFRLCNAAELLRYSYKNDDGSSKWAEDKILAFQEWMLDEFVPPISDGYGMANGGVSDLKGMLAVGIFCENDYCYHFAIDGYKSSTADVGITQIINENGQNRESGRDQVHSQLILGHLSELAWAANNQGSDLFSYGDHRLLKGYEYMAKYMMGEEVPYDKDFYSANYSSHPDAISETNRGELLPAYEFIYNYYTGVLKWDESKLPYTAQAVAFTRNEGITSYNGNYDTYHLIGYGTLSSAQNASPAKVGSAGVTAVDGSAKITWAAVTGAAGYNVYRSNQKPTGTDPKEYPVGLYTKLNSTPVTGTEYTDASLETGTGYFYKVTAVSGAGEESGCCDPVYLGTALTKAPASVQTAIVSDDIMKISWISAEGATGYHIYVSENGGSFKKLSEELITGTSCYHFGLKPGVQYQYKVQSVNPYGSSALSTAVGVRTSAANATGTDSGKILSATEVSGNAVIQAYEKGTHTQLPEETPKEASEDPDAPLIGTQPTITEIRSKEGFAHPSIGYTAATLTTMQKMVKEGVEPWKSGFEAIYNSEYSQLDYQIRNQSKLDPTKPAYTTVDNDAKAKESKVDAKACWNQTIMWLATGNNAYRAKAMQIIRLWGQMSPAKAPGFYDSHITMGESITNMTLAAEILRYTSCDDEELNWTDEDTQNFISNFLGPFAKDGNFYYNNSRWMNQHAINCEAYITVSIFADNMEDYKEAIEWTTVNSTISETRKGLSGSIIDQIRYLTVDEQTKKPVTPHLQLIECGRDQPHASGNISSLSSVALIAYGQGTLVDNNPDSATYGNVVESGGVNLFEFAGHRILAGANYHNKYNLGYDVLYTPCDVGEGGYYFKLNDESRGTVAKFQKLYMYYHYYDTADSLSGMSVNGDTTDYMSWTVEANGGLDSDVMVFMTEAMKDPHASSSGAPEKNPQGTYTEQANKYSRSQAYNYIGRSDSVSTSIYQDMDGTRSVLYDVRYAPQYTWYELTFADAVDCMTARVASNSSRGTKIDVVLLDGIEGITRENITTEAIEKGKVLATLQCPNTGWWTTYTTVTGDLNQTLAAGKHLIAFKYYDSANALGYQIAFDWFNFSRGFAGADNCAVDADSFQGCTKDSSAVTMNSGDSFTYEYMDFDAGNGTLTLKAATTAEDGVLKLVCGGKEIAVYPIARNTNGVLANITCEPVSGKAGIFGLNTVKWVYEGSKPLILETVCCNEINRVIEEAAAPTIRQVETGMAVISGSPETKTEDGATYVSLPDGSMISLNAVSLHTDRSKDAILSFRVRSNGTTKLNLHRESYLDPFAEILIPDTKGEWKMVSCNLSLENVSVDDLPYKLFLLYLGVSSETGSAVTVDVDYMDTADKNSAPYFEGMDSAEDYVYVGLNYKETLKAVDKDADSVTVSISEMPMGMSYDSAAGAISWKIEKAGDVAIYISADDGRAVTTIKKLYHVAASQEEFLKEITARYDENCRYTKVSKERYLDALEAFKEIGSSEASADEIQAAIARLKKAVSNLYSLDRYVELDGPDGKLQCLDMLAMADIKVTETSNGTVVDGKEYYKVIVDDIFTNKKDFYDGSIKSETGSNAGKGGYMQFDAGEGFAISLEQVYFHACTAGNDYKCLTGTYLAGSADGVNWTPITEAAVESKDWQQVEVTGNELYRYVRIMNDPDYAWWGVVGEVRLIGKFVETESKDPNESLNLDEIKAAIEQAEAIQKEDYTEESYQALEEALKKAIAVLGEKYPYQEDIDDACVALLEALAGLKEKPTVDKQNLQEAINKAEEIEEGKYTEESYQKLQTALKDAKEVLADENADQTKVDDACAALQEALEGLKEAEDPNPTGEPSVTGSPNPTGEPDMTGSPNPTGEPSVTGSPNPTGEPSVTGSPNPTGEPDVTGSPNPTGEPDVTVSPNPTGKPDVTGSPNPTGEPDVTVSPNPTGEPSVTGSPNPTGEPSVTGSPNPTGEPDVTGSPNSTEAPKPTEGGEYKAVISDMFEEVILTSEIKKATGCETIAELISYMQKAVTTGEAAGTILPGISANNTQIIDITVYITLSDGTRQKATALNFPADGVDVVIPYPTGTDKENYDFVVGHLITMNCNGQVPGTMEYFTPEKTDDGLKIHIYSASPFVVGWKEKAQNGTGSTGDNADSTDKGSGTGVHSPKTGDSTKDELAAGTLEHSSSVGWIVALLIMVLVCTAGIVGIMEFRRRKEDPGQER